MDSFGSGITQSWGWQWPERLGLASARGGSRRRLIAALVALAPIWAPLRAEAAGRVALVIDGEDYQKLPRSGISAKDANDIAEALRAKGFEVLLGVNPSNSRARAILLDFAQKANGADLAVAFLMGHATAARGQSYFLPIDTDLGSSTDLFSRGVLIASVAQVAGKARAGAVIVLMTTPNFEPAVPGLDPRPEYSAENPKSVVTVFSSSAKLPVSRIDAVSAQAADAVVKSLQSPAPSLADIVRAASGGVGAVFGATAEVSLAKPAPAPAIAPTTNAQAEAAAERRAQEEAAQLAAARLQLQQAKTQLAKEQAEKQQAQTAGASAQPAAFGPAPVDEKQLGQRQRQRIQESLRDMSLYTGPIDSIMGPLTREAIMGYQRRRGAKVTGYLTPDQFQELVPNGD